MLLKKSEMDIWKKGMPVTEVKECPSCECFWCARNYFGIKEIDFNTCHGFEPWSCRRTQHEGKCRMRNNTEDEPKTRLGVN